jgi:peptidylprolyl isomerase
LSTPIVRFNAVQLGRVRVPFRRCGLVLAALGAVVPVAGCGTAVTIPPVCTKPGPASRADDFSRAVSLNTTAFGIKYGDISVGCGSRLHAGEAVAAEFTGWLANGVEFASSRHPGMQPFQLILGQGQVTPAGLVPGMASMRVGGHRRIVIPPAQGYGPDGVPSVIPPNSTLVIDFEVVAASA